jgi:branched-chain amino acid transport system substrate-binding protein
MAGTATPVPAAEPYIVNVILPLSGSGSFAGKENAETLAVLEKTVNQSGGIAGRPLHFAFADDQSNAQLSVQLANGIIAQRAPLILGPLLTGSCNAVAPLVSGGPVMYCLSPGIHPPKDSFSFSGGVATNQLMIALVRYLRASRLMHIAILTSTDATGQDAERSLDEALALPENHDVAVVSREHFNPADISLAAQLSRVKATGPDVLIGWAAGTPAGLILHSVHDAGLTVPIVTSPANITSAQMTQYAAFLPKDLYFPAVPAVGPNAVSDKATLAQIGELNRDLSAAGLQVDYIRAVIWDIGRIVVRVLRDAGPSPTAVQLRDGLTNLKGFVGANGPYNFVESPQRGLSENSAVIVRWDAAKGTWNALSRPGGAPL